VGLKIPRFLMNFAGVSAEVGLLSRRLGQVSRLVGGGRLPIKFILFYFFFGGGLVLCPTRLP
jgi:hypothetical protein